MRVVSLLPSASEILCAIGGGHLLVGKSHGCDLPELATKNIPIITKPGIDAIDHDLIEQLKPDLILAGDGYQVNETVPHPVPRPCRPCEEQMGDTHQGHGSQSRGTEILTLGPTTIEGVFDDLLRVGQAVGLENNATKAVVSLRGRLHSAQDFVNPYTEGPTVGFLESIDPLRVAGLWTVQLIERAGGKHPWNPTTAAPDSGAAAGPQMAYRSAGKSMTVTPAQFAAEGPEFLVIAPCGLNLVQTRQVVAEIAGQSWFQSLPAVKNGNVALVDGNQMFNRPGPRLVDAFEFLVGFLNDRPGVIPVGFVYERI